MIIKQWKLIDEILSDNYTKGIIFPWQCAAYHNADIGHMIVSMLAENIAA